MPNQMTQEQLVDICRLMDINKDGFVDLNEFLESFRLAEKSLTDDDGDLIELEATWHEPSRRPSRTAADKDEIGVTVEILKLDDEKKTANNVMGETVRPRKEEDDIELIDCERSPPRRAGLLESDM